MTVSPEIFRPAAGFERYDDGVVFSRVPLQWCRVMDWQTAAEQLAQHLTRRGIRDARVLEQMATIPRHWFISPELSDSAYLDEALAIGRGQTISQPYIVALMTEAASVEPQSRVLEIGTGSGYQAAILARLCQRLVTIERIAELADGARACWQKLGLHNITSVVGDGSRGWPEGAPYDAILVTAGAPAVPEQLMDQLRQGGRLVIPVGDELSQELLLYIRDGDQLLASKLCDCRFVKLLGSSGWPLHPAPANPDEAT